MTQARNVTATFTTGYDLSVIIGGTGGGSVESNVAGITCPVDCSEKYAENTSVTLTATPNASSVFAGWSGSGCSGTGTCTVTMNQNRSVTATFTVGHDLNVTLSGTGGGTASSSPSGITCPADCSEKYAENTSVTLTATPNGSSVFTGWSGSGCSGTGTCVVTMNAPKNVTATFTAGLDVNVALSGTGSGSVSSTPSGINCPGDCVEKYAESSSVTLTATPNAGSVFTGWSGDCSGTGTCVLTMNAPKNVTATFTLGQTLTVTKAGTGGGTVTSNPAGIDCGLDCSESYLNGTSVTLTASENATSVFGGWSGDGCSGTNPVCTVTMDQARTITATFTNAFTLSVTVNGTGTVTSNPSGISCPGGDCSKKYAAGTTVTLTAGSGTFLSWGVGDCLGQGNPCTVNMTQDRSAVANFTP